jgi:hypothetical protein
MTGEEDREPPKRYSDKGEAIRHLIHAAVRMIAAGEDPFAVHLLVQSAEKLLIGVAKKRGDTLAFDWEDVIKPEYHSEFFKLHRETYNFFKHADKDTEDLPVHNIAVSNACFLAMAIENYRTVYGDITEHMKIFRFFTRLWKPDWFSATVETLVPEQKVEWVKNALSTLRTATPAEFFKAMLESQAGKDLERERNSDVSDGFEFWSTPFEKQTIERQTGQMVGFKKRRHASWRRFSENVRTASMVAKPVEGNADIRPSRGSEMISGNLTAPTHGNAHEKCD